MERRQGRCGRRRRNLIFLSPVRRKGSRLRSCDQRLEFQMGMGRGWSGWEERRRCKGLITTVDTAAARDEGTVCERGWKGEGG